MRLVPALLLALVSSSAVAAPSLRAPLGVTYSGWRGGFADAPARIATFREVGFHMVSFVPAYAYVGLDRVDVTTGPTADELGKAIELALRAGLDVVLKPHLEPVMWSPGYDRARSENHSWRAECGWRGFFDVDPMAPTYRDGVVGSSLRTLSSALARVGKPAGGARAPAVRLDLGAELMTSVARKPERWEQLLRFARAERRRLGLDGQVSLSHNFSHHIAIEEDVVGTMTSGGRRALARYIAGLDALALSQYMDLTIAMPPEQRGGRLPSPAEVADALVLHERNFRRDILGRVLGLRPAQIPPLHVGEFGVGSGGLRHPNLWGGTRPAAEEAQLAQQVARGHEGLLVYLALADGRTARSAVLWVTGPNFDVFGWRNPAWRIPAAAEAIRNALAPGRPGP